MAYCMFSPFIPYFACSLPMIGFQNITRDTAVIDIPDNTTKESQLGTSESRDENSFDEIIESQGIHGERSIMIAILQLHTSRVTFPVRVCLSSAAANTQQESCLSAEGPYTSICFLLMQKKVDVPKRLQISRILYPPVHKFMQPLLLCKITANALGLDHLTIYQVQSSAKRQAPGLVNFIPAVAYHFCLALPAAFT